MSADFTFKFGTLLQSSPIDRSNGLMFPLTRVVKMYAEIWKLACLAECIVVVPWILGNDVKGLLKGEFKRKRRKP